MNKVKEKLKEWLLPSEDDSKIVNKAVPNKNKVEESNKIVLHKSPRVFVIFHYLEVQEVANCLLFKQNVIVNVSNLENKQKYRVIDFLSGVIYVLDGKRTKLEANIYIFAINDKKEFI